MYEPKHRRILRYKRVKFNPFIPISKMATKITLEISETAEIIIGEIIALIIIIVIYKTIRLTIKILEGKPIRRFDD